VDTLTHALSGALLARATAPEPANGALPVVRRVVVGTLAAAFPDIDFVTGYLGPVAYLHYHRGVTHSLFLLPLWALLLAWLCALIWRRDRDWKAYFGVAALGVGIHILGDLITSFGTMIFAPFSDRRVGWATTFIIDLCFSGIIVLGLLLSGIWRSSRAPAVAALTLLATYVGWQALLSREAVEFGKAYASRLGWSEARVSAQPRPPIPLNWMVVAEDGERLDYVLLRLGRTTPRAALPTDAGFLTRLSAPYLPRESAIWVPTLRYGADPQDAAAARRAWMHPDFEFFRWFAAYPVLYRIDRGNHSTCVWFQDIRFFTPGRDVWPFRYGMCSEGDDKWQPFRLEGESVRLPVN
jgi:inner membrane protein